MITIKPSKRNTNKHTEQGMELLEKSIDKAGVLESISVATDGTIISGHARSELFTKKGMKPIEIKLSENEYPVIVTNIEPNTKEYYEAQILANTTANHNFNLDVDLIEEIVEEFDIDIEEVGVEVEEADPEPLEATEDDFDATPPAEPITILGDLYEIGEHRLLCGDSTDSDQVAKLMNGSKADMVFTDPPYGVSYQSNMRTKTEKFDVLENDNVFITEWINNLPLFSKGFVFVWTSWKVLKQWIEFCEPIGELSNLIVWDKGGGGIGDLKKTFLTDFEVALVYHRGAEIKGKRLGSVWSVGKDGASKYLHPTQKPIELPAMAIENITNQNELVLDFFLGSGSTMVASHQLKRKCYGMELDCRYADVIVKRMLKLDKTLKIKKNGIDETDKWLKLIE